MRVLPIEDGPKRLWPPDGLGARDGWCISYHGCWMPGVYADEKAARYAFSFKDEALNECQQRANVENSGLITYEMLTEAAMSSEEESTDD